MRKVYYGLSSSEVLGPMGHGMTYSGHPLGTAAGLAKLDILERENLTENE